ncbi:MAG: NAD(P)/FAD-dependent oxidoreductase [Candidatus Omnitrophica bacterium]|nr:NAD(P)/FAD-dependent oxidoreductase [Candidatus Omnitrophota bacterium]
MIKDELTIVGGGAAAITLIKELRAQNPTVKIRLLDRQQYSFDKEHYFDHVLSSSRVRPLYLTEFAKAHNIDFLVRTVERVQPNKKLLYCKNEEPLEYKTLALACGLRSRPLEIKGESRDSAFYLDEPDLFFIKDILKVSRDIIILAHTLLGLRLAFSLSFLQKEIKLFTGPLRFLEPFASEKERIFNLLRERGIDIYENTAIEEIIGEACVKAVKTSIPKVFAAQAVFIDSGFICGHKLTDIVPQEKRFTTDYADVYMLGDMADLSIEDESFFFTRARNVELGAMRCARLFSSEESPQRPDVGLGSDQIKDFLKTEFNVERRASLV